MTQKSILITGCSAGGLGAGLALEFARRGLRVFATVRTPSKASSLASVPNIEVLSLDVNSKESIAALVAEVKSRLGASSGLDYLVNNAGFGATRPLLDIDIDEAKKLYDTNVWGLLAVTQAFVPLLAESKGTLVNVTSSAGLFNFPFNGIYNSSKAAATNISEVLRLELAPLGIKVVTGMLGHIRSEFHGNDTWEGLPPSSYYKSIEPQVAKIASGDNGVAMQAQDVFCKNFVSDVLAGKTGMVWRGGMATIGKIVGYHLPQVVMDTVLNQDKGLDKLAKDLQKKRA